MLLFSSPCVLFASPTGFHKLLTNARAKLARQKRVAMYVCMHVCMRVEGWWNPRYSELLFPFRESGEGGWDPSYLRVAFRVSRSLLTA